MKAHFRRPLALAAVLSSAVAGAVAAAPGAGAVNPGGVPSKSPLTIADSTNQIKVMPAPTRAYLQRYASQLQRQNGTVTAWTVGGQALAAYDSQPGEWFRVDVHGADRYATSLTLATDFFQGQQTAIGVATWANFPDALSGGALMGFFGGPLLLVDPKVGITPRDADYVNQSHETVEGAFIFGGYSALPKGIDGQAGGLVAGAAGWLDLGGNGQVLSGSASAAAGPAGAGDAAKRGDGAADAARGAALRHGDVQPSR